MLAFISGKDRTAKLEAQNFQTSRFADQQRLKQGGLLGPVSQLVDKVLAIQLLSRFSVTF
jgi:hypothetical protein